MKPSKFWASQVRATAQDKMSKGESVKGCHKCYTHEKNNTPSSRLFYNTYDDVPSKDLPTMVDLDFSNFCNLKCLMCSPTRSSEWAKDQGYPDNGIKSISMELINDLVSISDDIEQMTIQGGEPSIMNEYEYYFECLDKKKLLRKIDLQIITNATNVNTRFYKLLEKFKSVRLSVSVDAFGKANNYIRWPSNFGQIEKNIIKMSELKNNVKVEILNSLNVLSMFNYHDFLSWCKKIELLYSKKGKYFGVVPMKVVDPVQWSPFTAPKNLKEKFIKDVKQFIRTDNLTHNSNFKSEIMMLVLRIQKNQSNQQAINLLKSSVKSLDAQRNIKIINYIPDFHNYI
jgi:organic radical activating enzyme